MKRLALILALLLIPVFAWGQQVIIAKKKPYCYTCPDANLGADVLCEVPDGTADGLGNWTITEDGGATGDIDFAATPDDSPALGCTDIPMTYCIQMTKTNTTLGKAYARYAFGSTKTTLYIPFYIKVLAEGLADGEYQPIISVNEAAGTNASLEINLTQVATNNLRFLFKYYTSDWQTDTGGTNLSLDTWYGIRIKAIDDDRVQWWVDYSNDGTWTDEGEATGLTLSRAMNGIEVGTDNMSKTLTFQVIGLKVDDDTMPGACAR